MFITTKISLKLFLTLTIYASTIEFHNAFSLKTFVSTVLNDVLFLNKTQTPLGLKCHQKLNLWYQNLNSPNKTASWSLLGWAFYF